MADIDFPRALEDFANQRVAVGMWSAGGDSDQRVADPDRGAVDDIGPFDGADAEAGQVVFAVAVHVWHFGCLATDKRGPGLLAASGDSADDGGCDVDIQVPTSEIVKEEQRLGSLHDNIVDAHRDEIDTNRIVAIQVPREHEFGADTVGARYEYRFAVAISRQGKQAAKSAKTGHDLRAAGSLHQRLDAIDERIARIDIDTGIFVRQWFFGHLGSQKKRGEKNGRTLRERYNSRWASQGKPPYMKFYFLALLGVFALSSVGAVEVAALYTAQVPMDQTQNDPQTTAYETALAEVILRVSGPGLVQDADLFVALFPSPSALVLQYRPGPDNTIFVSFDGDAIEKLLRTAGQTVWGSERPLTLIWLAVDWGRGEREIIGASDGDRSADEARSINRNRLLRQRLLNFAESRGLPIAFPLLDSEDLINVSFSDIWGGFDTRVLDASRRYDVDSVLIGRVRVDSAQRNRWTYHFDGDSRTWTGEPEIAIMRIWELLAAEFGIGGDAPLRTIQLNISGVSSVDSFGTIQNMLASMNVIETFAITSVDGDRISFRVSAHGGSERLARALRLEGLVEEEQFGGGDTEIEGAIRSLNFFYSP